MMIIEACLLLKVSSLVIVTTSQSLPKIGVRKYLIFARI